MKKLNAAFYQQDDVVALARYLIGTELVTEIDGLKTSGIITETEAYRGYDDKACHAHLGRFTERTKVMYETGGVAYVYLCYGIHYLFNIITNKKHNADAILIRAIQPTSGLDHMLKRRNKSKVEASLTSGPGNVSKALGISKSHYGEDLQGSQIYILDKTKTLPVIQSVRIGIDYAGEDAQLPWRFYAADNPYVSKKLKADTPCQE